MLTNDDICTEKMTEYFIDNGNQATLAFPDGNSAISACPLCGQTTSKASARLIRDECGHMKCRICLLKEEHGCTICQNEKKQEEENSKIEAIGNFDYSVPESNMTNDFDEQNCAPQLIEDKLNDNNIYGDSIFDDRLELTQEEVESSQNDNTDFAGIDFDFDNTDKQQLPKDDFLTPVDKEPVINDLDNLQNGHVTSTINYNVNESQINDSAISNENNIAINVTPSFNGHINGTAIDTDIKSSTNTNSTCLNLKDTIQMSPNINQNKNAMSQLINNLPKPVGVGPSCRIILLRIVNNQNKNVAPGLIPIKLPESTQGQNLFINPTNIINNLTVEGSKKNEQTADPEADLSDFLLFNKKKPKEKDFIDKRTKKYKKSLLKHKANLKNKKSNGYKTKTVDRKISKEIKIKSDIIISNYPLIQPKPANSTNEKKLTPTNNGKSVSSNHQQKVITEKLKDSTPDSAEKPIQDSNRDATGLLGLASVASYINEMENSEQQNGSSEKSDCDDSTKTNEENKENTKKEKTVTEDTAKENTKEEIPFDSQQENVRRGGRNRKPKVLLYEGAELNTRDIVRQYNKSSRYRMDSFSSEESQTTTELSNGKENEPVVKRKRGRPRKIRVEMDSNVIVKRKRGRPRKNEVIYSQILKKDGVKQSIVNESSEKVSHEARTGDDKEQNSNNDDAKENEIVEEEDMKLKLDGSDADDSSTNANEKPETNGSTEDTNAKSKVQNTPESSTAAPQTAPIVRKRGRPRKYNIDENGTKVPIAKQPPPPPKAKRPRGRPRRDWSHIVEQADGRYKCQGCDRTFGRYNSKIYHGVCSKVAGQEPPSLKYKCDKCDREFAAKQHYLYHYRGHTGDRPFKCDQCKKGFRTKGKLNRHLMCHKEEYDIECDDCGKLFNSKDNLKIHLTVHKKERFRCRYCPSVYTFEHNRKRHEERHTSTEWFKCAKCPKKFRTKFFLHRHMRVHGQARPFGCEQCDRFFLTRFELQRHVTTHFGDKVLACDHCEERFSRTEDFVMHLQFNHPQLVTNVLSTNNVISTADCQGQIISNDAESLAELVKDAKIENFMTENEVAVIVKRPRGRPKKLPSVTTILPSTIKKAPLIIERYDDDGLKPIPLEEVAEINRKIEERIGIADHSNSPTNFIHTELADNEQYNSDDREDASSIHSQELELEQGVVAIISSQSKGGDVPQHWRRRTAESLKPRLMEVEE
ncbi:uncharacterized protein LOC106656500 isoform X1 [Trichogramma pretiosum]|uniref:uncharacterized protein LOC106656500 isoform X1 n=1 Tax=Trichogramma pretiosum TaxID=7493 RepID=UPI000C71A988|nr:uncharacterized protein LOC106656500 isoform X1 [Trichogramma pretiosum]